MAAAEEEEEEVGEVTTEDPATRKVQPEPEGEPEEAPKRRDPKRKTFSISKSTWTRGLPSSSTAGGKVSLYPPKEFPHPFQHINVGICFWYANKFVKKKQ